MDLDEKLKDLEMESYVTEENFEQEISEKMPMEEQTIKKELQENIQEKKINNKHKMAEKFLTSNVNATEDDENNIEREHTYIGEDGEPKYKIVKYKSENNRFASMRYEEGNYVFGINGVEKIPYNIPNLLKVNDGIIWILNGENKVDLFSSLGLIATTAPFFGKYKWKSEYNKYLKNAKGIIIIKENKENDEAYCRNTKFTLSSSFNYKKIAFLGIDKLLNYFNLKDENIKSFTDLYNIVQDKEELKNLLVEIEQEMLQN